MKTANELLSKSERRVIDTMCHEALSKKEVAHILKKSYNTINTQCISIFKKLNITKASELQKWYMARKYGIVEAVKELQAKNIIVSIAFMGLVGIAEYSHLDMRRAKPVKVSHTRAKRKKD